MQDDKIKIIRIDPITVPPPDDDGWIKNAKGEIIGNVSRRGDRIGQWLC